MIEVRQATSDCCGATTTRHWKRAVFNGVPSGREWVDGDYCDKCGNRCEWHWSEWRKEACDE